MINGISRIGYMSGGDAARWVDEDIADTLVGRAVGFIEANQDKPFFLYYATQDIHVPRIPHARFQGTTACGIRCDAIAEMDFQVGVLLDKLDELQLSRNTLVVFSSDNGPVLDDGYQDGAVQDLNGHNPAGTLRGGKYSIFEGGTRVPFITRWPGVIAPGSSSALVSLIDMLASGAALSGKGRPAAAGPDSFNVLEALLGLTPASTRDHLVTSTNGTTQQAIRVGDWKFIPGNPPRLFDLSQDIHEDTNVAAANPDKVKELSDLLAQIKADGSSRPENDGFVFEPLPPAGGGAGGGAAGVGGVGTAGSANGAGGPPSAAGTAGSGGNSGNASGGSTAGPGAAAPRASGDAAGCGCAVPGGSQSAPLILQNLGLLLGLTLFGRVANRRRYLA